MSVLKRCQDYYERRLSQFGYPPTKIMMYQSDLDKLVEELKYLPKTCCDEGRYEVMGMEIIVLENKV